MIQVDAAKLRPVTSWLGPAPLWRGRLGGEEAAEARRPELFRFASDDFMDRFQQILDRDAESVGDFIARGETWRDPRVGQEPASGDLKLFQPAHQRFYLVAASLTCRLPGLPDRKVATPDGERVGFVLRRLEFEGTSAPTCGPEGDKCAELAWSTGATRPGWARATNGRELHPAEEVHSAFGVRYEDGARPRTIHAGLVPVGRREGYAAAPLVDESSVRGTVALEDPRVREFRQIVTGPVLELREATTPRGAAAQNAFALGKSVASALIYLDLVRFLERHLPAVALAVTLPSGVGTLSNAESAFLTALDPVRNSLESAAQKADAIEGFVAPNSLSAGSSGPLPGADATKIGNSRQLRALEDLLDAALPPRVGSPADGPPPPPVAPLNVEDPGWYVIRFVLTPPPTCGGLRTPILSLPTRPFQLAGFFDPDAPARKVQIALPVDTSPAGLRKHDKGMAVMLSNELSRQMARVKGMEETIDGDFKSSPPFDLGKICSFSIPIVTICALIILMILVQLLNIVFFWIPFFKVCFPIPLKAKS